MVKTRGEKFVELALENETKSVEKEGEKFLENSELNDTLDSLSNSFVTESDDSDDDYDPGEELGYNENLKKLLDYEEKPKLFRKVLSLSSSDESDKERSISPTIPYIEPLSADYTVELLHPLKPEEWVEKLFTGESTSNNEENKGIIEMNLDDVTKNDSNETTFIQKDSKSKKSKAKCKYCPLCVTNYERHLQRQHPDEELVKKLLTCDKKTKERREIMRLIRNDTTFTSYIESNNPQDMEKYPCIFCKGLFTRNYLRRHKKKCGIRKSAQAKSRQNHLAEAQNMLVFASESHNNETSLRVKSEVFSIMKADVISAVAKTDKLIRQFGECYLKKHYRKQMVYPCSNKMRELARLLICVRNVLNNEQLQLVDILEPVYFDTIVYCAKDLGGYDPEKKTYRAASLSAHLGTSLKNVSNILLHLLLKKNDLIKYEDIDTKYKEVKRFKDLVSENWTTEVSSLAFKTLDAKKWAKPQVLPLTRDVQKLRDHCLSTSEESVQALEKNLKDEKAYKSLVEATLALTILFNRKRIGDVQYLYMDTYKTDFSANNAEECLKALSSSELELSKFYKRVITGGKGHRAVPILFPKNLQSFIEIMLKCRSETTLVPKENPYLFAYPKSKDRWVRGDKVIAKMAKHCNLEQPQHLTGNKLRKQISSIMQILNLSPEESAQFSQFMGHTEKTHEEFYKLPQDIYQTAKVSKLLLIMDKGSGAKYQGKSLAEIDINPETEFAEVDDEEIDEPEAVNLNNSGGIGTYEEQINENENSHDEGTSKEKTVSQKRRSEDQISDLSDDSDCGSSKNKKGRKAKRANTTWTSKQISLVKNHFKKHIKTKTAPKKKEVMELVDKYPSIFTNLNWVKIKAYVYNEYRGR